MLLLDGRVRLRPGGLAFVHDAAARPASASGTGTCTWSEGNPYGAFLNVLAEIAWRRYFDDPRTTSFDANDFDRYPKGTTCFLAPRDLLLQALGAFPSRVLGSAPCERRHTCAQVGRGARAHPHLAVLRMRVQPADDLGLVRPVFGSSRRRVPRRPRPAGVSLLPGLGGVLPGERRACVRGAAPAGARPGRRRRPVGRSGRRRSAQRPAARSRRPRRRARAASTPPRTVSGMWQRAGSAGPSATRGSARDDPRRLRDDRRADQARTGAPAPRRARPSLPPCDTGQQVQQIPSFLEQFGLRQPDLWLARGSGGRDLRTNRDIPGWLATRVADVRRASGSAPA